MNWYLQVLKRYADFSGRSRRKEFWMFTLINILIYIGLVMIIIPISFKLIFIPIVYILATVLPSLAARVRRMHDVGKSGWHMFIPIYSFILAVTEGDYGENEY